MTDQEKELFYDLLVKKATCGLDAAEESELAAFDRATVDAEFTSLERTAAAIGLAAIEIEPRSEEHTSELQSH